MPKSSITGAESFRFRIQRSEAKRAVLMCGVYTVMILVTLGRRLSHGVVMSDDSVFMPYIGVLIVALAYEIFATYQMRASVRNARIVPRWKLTAKSVVELAVPALLLGILHYWSPRGMYAALSAPALLLFPITILMSVLSLRPRTTLLLGVGAAIIHAILSISTVQHEHLDANQYPVLLSYAVLLALTGVGGFLVSRAARMYVAEAVDEAQARERSALRLAGIERDLEVAKQIQVGLLPAGSPKFAGFDIVGMNRPADQTGGDYYDWQLLPDGRLLVVMADVTGHGIGPALVMAVCRAYARASAPLDSNPTSLMARINDLLHGDNIGGRFITLAMAVLNPTGQVELVSAGHGPSLLFCAGANSVEQFGGDGLPLAVSAAENYGPARTFTMQRDDVLVLITDGVMEWQNNKGVQFGTTRLADALSQSANRPAARILEHIDQVVRTFAQGAPQTDDVTIVVIKRNT